MTGPVHIERRLDTPKWLKLAVPLASLVLAAIIVAILLLATGHNPLSTYHQMYSAAITADGALSSTFVYATPLLFTGLCAAFAFRMRTWNIGGEGQLYMGAVGASATGSCSATGPGRWSSSPWSSVVPWPGCCGPRSRPCCEPTCVPTRSSPRSCSTMWPGFFMYYLIYDSDSYWRDLTTPGASVFPTGKTLGSHANWPGITIGSFTLPLGFVLGVGLAVGLLAAHPLHALRLRDARRRRFPAGSQVLGHPHQAEDPVGDGISGGIAGIAGSSQIGDFGHVLDPRGLEQAQYGYTGIVVAALALLQPDRGRAGLAPHRRAHQRRLRLGRPSFPTGLVGTMEGIILFTVLGGEILARYRISLATGVRSVAPWAPGAMS